MNWYSIHTIFLLQIEQIQVFTITLGITRYHYMVFFFIYNHWNVHVMVVMSQREKLRMYRINKRFFYFEFFSLDKYSWKLCLVFFFFLNSCKTFVHRHSWNIMPGNKVRYMCLSCLYSIDFLTRWSIVVFEIYNIIIINSSSHLTFLLHWDERKTHIRGNWYPLFFTLFLLALYILYNIFIKFTMNM